MNLWTLGRNSGWLPVGFRNLNNISKSFNWHRPRSQVPNGSYFEVSCHCLSIRPISRFESRRGMGTPRSVLNLNINTFFTHRLTLVGSRRWNAAPACAIAWLSRLFFLVIIIVSNLLLAASDDMDSGLLQFWCTRSKTYDICIPKPMKATRRLGVSRKL